MSYTNITKYDIDRVTLVLPSSHESNGVTLTLKWVGSKCTKQCMMITVMTTHEVTRQCFKSEHQNETYREICIYLDFSEYFDVISCHHKVMLKNVFLFCWIWVIVWRPVGLEYCITISVKATYILKRESYLNETVSLDLVSKLANKVVSFRYKSSLYLLTILGATLVILQYQIQTCFLGLNIS